MLDIYDDPFDPFDDPLNPFDGSLFDPSEFSTSASTTNSKPVQANPPPRPTPRPHNTPRIPNMNSSTSNNGIGKVGLPIMVGCGGLLTIGVIGLILAMMAINIKNTEVQLRTQFDAKQDEATLAYDDMWKIISEQAGVASSYRDSFGEIYNDMISARYEHGGGQVMQWITEQNPEFDTSLMSDLMASIEAQRTTSRRVQTELLDIEREHTAYVQMFPNSLIVGGQCCLDAQIVTSSRTERSFETGRDDETLDFNNLGRPQAE